MDTKEQSKIKPADAVHNPKHYTSHPSGVECITVTEHMGFCLGNAVKYIWRADEKGNAIEDLQKAKWYIEREIERRTAKETMNEPNQVDAARLQPIAIRTSNDERIDWTPCCAVEFRGEIKYGDKCPGCNEVMLWCRGCGNGDGSNTQTCDRCGSEFCDDCGPFRDDDTPVDLCDKCCA